MAFSVFVKGAARHLKKHTDKSLSKEVWYLDVVNETTVEMIGVFGLISLRLLVYLKIKDDIFSKHWFED